MISFAKHVNYYVFYMTMLFDSGFCKIPFLRVGFRSRTCFEYLYVYSILATTLMVLLLVCKLLWCI